MNYDTATPYISVYILLRNKNKAVFIFRSNTDWMNNHYDLPSGKVEKNETFSEAAIREAKEEIGVTIDPKHLRYLHTVHRLDDLDWVDICFEALEWHGDIINAEPHVHSEVTWLDLDDLPENVIPCTKDVLEQIAKGKTYSEYGWRNE